MKEVNCRNCDNLQTDYPISDSVIKGGFIEW